MKENAIPNNTSYFQQCLMDGAQGGCRRNHGEGRYLRYRYSFVSVGSTTYLSYDIPYVARVVTIYSINHI